ncbi:MAG TPA: pyridoxamine 5'-phosphate oxidase family protein [Candidatus Binataceae bacterium]|nr:pyridoxamine 5'-phosphate oxidase family protein [Candidatus Binataceae bacterium]
MNQITKLGKIALATAVALVVVLSVASGAQCETSARDIDALSKASLIYIATVRKDGNQSKAAPVWFTTTADNIVLIQTAPDSWKAKRIRRGSPAMIWIGDANGPAFIAKAEITSDAEVINRIVDDFPKRYLMARVGIHKPTLEKFQKGERVAIRITPIRDLPEGFKSEPGTPAPKLDAASAAH